MRTLVTGATGFIGSSLVDHLVNRKQNQQDETDSRVYCLIRSTSSLIWIKNLAIEFVYGDLFADAALRPVLSEITHVFHLAGVTKARTPEEYFQANGEATRHLLELCARHAQKLQRFVYVSSQAAAGPSPDGHLISEDEPPRPISIYGRSKFAGEQACHEFRGELPITIIRPPAVYGPRERDIYQYFKQVKMGFRLRLGWHERKVSLIHVNDLVTGILLATEHPRAVGETYFLTNPEPYDWHELGQMIAEVMRRRAIAITIPEWIAPAVAAVSELGAKISGKPALLNFDKVREMRQYYWVCSGEKAKQHLGFEPTLSIAAGLRDTWQWYREMGWLRP